MRRLHSVEERERQESERERFEIEQGLENTRNSMAETGRRLAQLEGQTLGVIESMRTDPKLTEILRLQAWARHDPKALRGRVTMHKLDGDIKGVPDGWPKGVNARQFIDRWVNAKIQEKRSEFDEESAFRGSLTDRVEETESVAKLRDIIERGAGPKPLAKQDAEG